MMANAVEPDPPIPLYKLTQAQNHMFLSRMQRLKGKLDQKLNSKSNIKETVEVPKFKGWLEIVKNSMSVNAFAQLEDKIKSYELC
jgi:hypothetical protein